MKRGKKTAARRPAPGGRAAARPARWAEETAADFGLAEIALWLLVVLPPLFIVPSARESFRLPKLMLAEWLGLASLVGLAWRLRQRQNVERLHWRDLARMPALRAAAPLVAVALIGLGITRHPLHARQATIDLAIGAACLVGWSAGLGAARLRRALELMLWPAAALALFGILQFHGVYRPLQFVGTAAASRLGVTSLAGNPGDLAGFLVLPCLVAQWRLSRATGAARVGTAIALALSVYCLAATQTFSALAAAALGSAVLWGMRGIRLGGRWRTAAAGATAGAAAVALLLVLVLPPLRARVEAKTIDLRAGQWNAALSGRLDGWRAAAFLLAAHPLAGVGQGAFRAEFAPAKLALLDRGVPFYPDQPNAYFANAHDEILEVGADLGWPGLAALAWGIGMLWAALWRLRADDGSDAAFAWAGTAAIAVLSLAQFPFRIALVAFPALLFFAWTFRASAEAAPEAAADGRGEGGDGPGAVSGRALGWALTALLALAWLGQSVRAERRIAASQLLGRVEALSMAAMQAGRAPAGLLAANLAALDRAAALDPSEVEVQVARGGQFLVFGRAEAAIGPYERALSLEPHPEIYLDLARAYLAVGDSARARQSLDRALRLSPWLRPQAPSGIG